ncbi:hypothetical protein Ait01nite_047150 [Actinoplanes italicus]|uniref:Methyltransferase family protein n=1 Tax=Actinoplanes italicus TaxID=113567 RepID=A0A2T0K9J9_9ACTN|nr:hypothetical protein [Actinoplanes italicus]PRX19818.1 hypothetical protein CLV67_10983 [Actinoplanes italicus]GIE31670.1 hypothetical protein Ait01nite_047150 [Actinoplanes italicus]
MTALLLGGEMPHWSDYSPARGVPLRSPVRGVPLRELAASAHGHVLVVGPHDAELIEAIPARQVTVLVRGVPDAEELAARWADRPGVQVCCGSLEKLAAVPAYDTVVALDGLDRTGSTETGDLPWSAGLAQLLAVLRPGGRLLLSVANPVGLHALYAGATPPEDSAWGPPAGDDPTRPAGLDALREQLRSAGLEPLRDYAAYPSPQSPSVLLSEEALTDSRLHGFLTSALRRAGLPAGPLLADPRPLAGGLLRHGLAVPLAPAWIVVAARPGHHPSPLPDGLVADGRLLRTSGGWLADGVAVAAGDCLHDALLAAARSGDRPSFRALLTTWQSGAHAAVPAEGIVVSPGGALHASPAAPTDPAALSLLASALHDEGLSHLWPADDTERLLAAMAGREEAPAHRATPQTLRELTAAHDRLAQRLEEARIQLIWYEQRTATLQAGLNRAHRIITVLKATPGGRAATAVLAGARRGKRLASAALRRLR